MVRQILPRHCRHCHQIHRRLRFRLSQHHSRNCRHHQLLPPSRFHLLTQCHRCHPRPRDQQPRLIRQWSDCCSSSTRQEMRRLPCRQFLRSRHIHPSHP